ncbi:PH domain-containing protein [Agrococcus jenensis]|uniref:PH domain-containing protein n=1 Tax=Agrococcus jenensis TaxID=46353 RepID=UPI000F4C338E|nr:PH domain-containing protein [Agrococcus jenensis]
MSNDDLHAVTVHSRVNRGVAVACWALLAVLGALVALQSEPRGALAAVILAVWLGYAVLVFLWAPALVVDDRGAELRNPLRTVRVLWDALIHVDTKYALTLFTPGRSWPVWVAPQPGALAARRAARRARDGDRTDPRSPLDTGVRVGDLPGTESGDAAALVRRRWAALADRSADAEAIAVPVTVHWARVAVLVAGPVLAATAPLLV